MYRIYPKGYDPRIAAEMPNKDEIEMGITWTLEDVKRHRLLESQRIVSSNKPINQWYMKI